jgi:hypothetical protein
MGSGKGKQNRAQSNTDQLWYDPIARTLIKNPVVTDHNKWVTFVDKQNLANVRLSDYYNVPLQPSTGSVGRVPLPQYTKIMEELLRDLVDIGVITLPAGASAKDFKLITGNQKRGDWDKLGDIAVTILRRGYLNRNKKEVLLWQPDIALKNNTKFGSKQADYIVTLTCAVIEKLFT